MTARGTSVVVSDIQEVKERAVAAEIAQAGGQALAVDCARAAAERFGGIDYLVNNAGLLTTALEQPLH